MLHSAGPNQVYLELSRGKNHGDVGSVRPGASKLVSVVLGRSRIERLCALAEVIVGERLPNAEDALARTHRYLELDPETWTTDEIRLRHEGKLREEEVQA